MTFHTTTEAYAFGRRRIAMPVCPHCGDIPVAPASAGFAGCGRVRHVWACESCGYAFQTAISYGARRSPDRGYVYCTGDA
jgi:hypothetical protein